MDFNDRCTSGINYYNRISESRNRRIVTIHKAIEDGTYHNLKHLLSVGRQHQHHQRTTLHHNNIDEPVQSSSSLYYDCTLLWESNGPAGWTACHFAASNFVPTEWWKWIMEHASLAPLHDTNNTNLFVATKNALGQTVVDIFFRSYIRPVGICKFLIS